jgi:hypothetical protein
MYVNAYVNQLLVYQTFILKEERGGEEKKPFLFVVLFASSERKTKEIRKKSIIEHKAE